MGTAASSSKSPGPNGRSANVGVDGGRTSENEKAASQKSSTATRTPADILSQKLDLNDPVKRAEVVRQLKEIEVARKKEAWE